MKIPAPNHTQSPNVFYDEIFKTLKEGELRVILVIIRQTFGWHKSFDRISLGQLAEKTGMERKSVCRSLNSLIQKGLVAKKKFGDSGTEKCYYSLVTELDEAERLNKEDGIETEEEKKLISNNYNQCPKDTPPVSQRHPPQCPKDTPPSVLKTPTKETNTKETNQKKQQQAASPSAAAFSCLKEFSLDKDAISALMKFSEDRVVLAVQYVKEKGSKIKDITRSLIWHCQQEKPVKASSPKIETKPIRETYEKTFANQKVAEKFVRKNIDTLGDHLYLRPDYIKIDGKELYFYDIDFDNLFSNYIGRLRQ